MNKISLCFILLFITIKVFSQNAQLDQKKVDAIETLVSNKLLKFDYDLEKAWVSPAVWAQYNVDGKNSFTQLCALYIRYRQKERDKNPAIDLFDYNTGKQIASYGPIRGFRLF
jgi:hypothetical protein